MDKVEDFKPFASAYDKPGLYYVEIDQFVPTRGNGWYSHAMVKLRVDNLLIHESDIKYVVYSSLTIPKDYFNPCIEYIYTNFGRYPNHTINTMIGIFKISTKVKYRTLATSEDSNVMLYHCLEKEPAIVQPLSCEDKVFPCS